MMDGRSVRTNGRPPVSRRGWLRGAFSGCLGLSCSGIFAAQSVQSGRSGSEDERSAEAELEGIRSRLEAARIGPIHVARSAHYQGIGDAAEAFIKLILDDCEQLAEDYRVHFRKRELPVKMPQGRLTVVLLRDERSFGRFLRLPAPAHPVGGGAVLQPSGVYDRKTNLLQVFDWRNVPMAPRSASRNSETLAHEGTHQLTFNTGLLSREGDIPICIVEGLGTYGEPRQPRGPSELGRVNVKRLDDLAKIQRQVPWIPLKELITDDAVLRAGKAARVLLGYAQSWLLVHYLMKTPTEMPRFRNYLKAIASRTTKEHRLEDAQAHLGDLDALDRELRRYSIRLLRSG
ncbi:MAG: DUF1570 domain-containing protein [Isosphaeraceae bacterium]